MEFVLQTKVVTKLFKIQFDRVWVEDQGVGLFFLFVRFISASRLHPPQHAPQPPKPPQLPDPNPNLSVILDINGDIW